MSGKRSTDKPYQALGNRLKCLRERLQETLAEVSGAVEIDIEKLVNIEQGIQRPSEDILLLLISHFSAREDEATKLWELAGFDKSKIPGASMSNDDTGGTQPSVMVIPLNMPIMYTDSVHVMVNNYGVIVNFLQNAGVHAQPNTIARVGMSRKHAESLLKVLQETLKQADNQSSGPKYLPGPKE